MNIDHRYLLSHFDGLLRLPSVSSGNVTLDMSNQPVVAYLADALTALGFRCELLPSPSHSGNPKFNLVATLGDGPGGLVLAGHTDTVPLDADLWQVDPFRMTEKDGRLYGLGSTDMKGFFALVLEAVRPLKDAHFHAPLIVLATADEETSMAGARSLVEQGYPGARHAIIGEPTSMVPVRAHKGVMMEAIRIQGRSGHSSDPSLGRNALDAMTHVMNELMALREEFKIRFRDPLFHIDHPTLNLGCIHGGDNPNRICGHCDLEIDIRTVPAMDIDTIRAELITRLRPIGERLEVALSVEPLFAGAPAFAADADSRILRTVEQLTGTTGISVAFGTEAPFLKQLGMDTIVFGPGDIAQAHQPDEFLALDRIAPCVQTLRDTITTLCLTPAPQGTPNP